MSSVHTPPIAQQDLDSFASHVKSSKRILALCGAGMSAASGLPTFRGAGGIWRNLDALNLATLGAFNENPGLVWHFYGYRRHMALNAKPNPAHYALAALARKKPDFITITQNVDGLSTRAGHPAEQLHLLHGSLFDIKCFGFDCDYVDKDNFTDPVVPALQIPRDPADPSKEADISSAAVQLQNVRADQLPHCPKCATGLLRPGVVWFGESLPVETMSAVDHWTYCGGKIDLMIVVGTSAVVYPAAGYIQKARNLGARVAVINTERPDQAAGKLQPGDWFFQGDAGQILPQILEPFIGPVATT